MPQKIKEEERIERIIRGLLKLPDNRRCINCNSLGPQYACTTFWTFVCTNCSGVHREFTHRVKSVSMAKFTADEIAALQAGGNERAKQIYFKTWDPQRNSYPDSCNLHALRTFIKHVYLDRKYSGERKNDYPSVDKAVVKDDYAEKFRIKPREDFFERRYAEKNDYERCSYEKSGPSTSNGVKSLSYYIEERSSPRDKQENSRSSSSRRRSRGANFEIVDDRFRDHETVSAKQYGSHRFANPESRARSSSPVSVESRHTSSHPRLLPLKDILGNNAPRLRVGEPPKGKADSIAISANIKNEGSGGGKEDENKKVITHSLIDFDADFDSGPTPQTAPCVLTGQGSADPSMNDRSANNPPFNPMDSLLLDLAGPVTTPTPAVIMATESTSNATMPSNVIESSKADTEQFPAMEHNQLFQASFGNNNISPIEAAHNQTSTSEQVTNDLSGQSSQAVTDIVQVNNSGNGSDFGGRKELPADLFASIPSSFGGGPPSWQFSQPYGVGYNIQQNPSAMVSQDAIRSRNPFDLDDSGPQQEAVKLPSMPVALASQPPIPCLSSQFPPAVLPQGNPYGMMAPPASYMGQHLSGSTIESRPQGFQNPSSSNDAFASLIPIQIQRSSGVNSVQVQENSSTNPAFGPENPHSLIRGNPFG